MTFLSPCVHVDMYILKLSPPLSGGLEEGGLRAAVFHQCRLHHGTAQLSPPWLRPPVHALLPLGTGGANKRATDVRHAVSAVLDGALRCGDVLAAGGRGDAE